MLKRYLFLWSLVLLLMACSSGGSPANTPSGIGLSAEYFQNNDLSGLKYVQTDSQIFFDWGTVEPALGMRPGPFSARWTGSLEAPKSQLYTFYLTAKGQASLSIDGQTVIAAGASSGTANLSAGKHSVKLEYVKTSEEAALKLEWSYEGQVRAVVSRAYLYPAATASVSVRSQAVPTGQNLLLNPGFEGGTGAWISYGSGTYAVATPGRSGTGQAASASNWAWVQQDLPASSVEAGSTYTLSVWGRSVGGKTCTAGFAGGSPNTKVFQQDVSFIGGWENKTTALNLPAGTTWLSVFFSSNQPECQFDDFSIVVGGTVTPPTPSSNVLLNGDFEAGTNPWDIIGGVSSVVAGRSGGSALQGSGWTWAQQNLGGSAIQVGATLTLQGWAKANGGTCTIGFSGGDATTVTFSRTLAFQGTTWTQQSLTQQIPAGTTWMAVYLTTTNEACQFDDLSLGQPNNTPPNGTGTGLLGEYFDNMDFTGTKQSRTDATVNFNWDLGAPATSIGADTFSVRWNGEVQPRYSGEYTFFTTSDDGVRLWVNNTQIINNWTDHGATVDQGKITLQAGQKYPIRMEYYENGGYAQAKLEWQSTQQAREVVPATQLYPGSVDYSGTYNVVHIASNKCMDVNGGSSADGANVQLWTCTGGTNQIWKIEKADKGYRLTVQHSGKVLDVAGVSMAAGANVYQWAWLNGDNQKWNIRETASGLELTAVHSNKCLDVANNASADGTNIQQWDCNDSAAQRFKLISPITAPSVKSLQGEWSSVIPFSIVPVSAANLPSGKILLWSANDRNSFGGTGLTYTIQFDPSNNQATEAIVSNTSHAMFCPGTAMLGDGNLLVAGGSDASTTSIYNPSSNQWVRGPNLNLARGYNSMATLQNGDVFTVGGTWSGGAGDKYGEAYNRASNSWKALPGASANPLETSGGYNWYAYPFATNGKILAAGNGPDMLWYDTSGQGSYTSAGKRGDDQVAQQAVMAMIAPGKLLKAGGQTVWSGGNPLNSSYIIDTTTNSVSVRKVANMQFARSYATPVIFPNGQVGVFGGNAAKPNFSDDASILTPELFDPTSEQWRSLANMSVPRNYHSIAILLTDGRVLAAGGGLCGTCTTNHPDGQIFTPPYLFNSDGTLAARPSITSSPANVVYGQSFNVSTDGAVSRFSLVRLSSVTHTVNTDQRYIPLTPTANNSTSYSLTAPSNAAAVPGNYMLFALNAQGVPSVAKIIRVGP